MIICQNASCHAENRTFSASLSSFSLAMLLLLFLLTGFFSVSGDPADKTLLFLDSYHPGYLWSEDVRQGVRDTLAEAGGSFILRVEFMDTKHFPPEELFPYLAELYTLKFRDQLPHVIISSDNNALNFLRLYRDAVFPGVPVVFCGVNDYNPRMIEGMEAITGVAEKASFFETIDLALKLFPQTERIFAIAGNAETTLLHTEELRRVEPSFRDRVDFIGLYKLSSEDLAAQLEQIPTRSLILYLGFYRDALGKIYTVDESFHFIREHTDAPVVTMWSQNLPFCLGGVQISGYQQGREAVLRALEILKGADPSDIPVMTESPNLPMFNYNELSRLGVNEKDLPENTVFLNLPAPTFFQQYTYVIIAVIVVLALFIFLSLFLSIAMKRRNMAMEHLSRIRGFMNNILDSMPSALISVDEFFRIQHWNSAAETLTGISRDDALGLTLKQVFPGLNEIKPIVRKVMTADGPDIITREETREGQKIRQEITIFPISGSDEKGAVLRIDDISEKEKIEELRAQSEILKDQLVQAQKIDSIGRLAGGVAHDLNNLLVPIIGYAQLLQREKGLSEKQKKEISHIYNAGNRSRELVQQLLAFSRKQNLKFQSEDLNRIIEDFIPLLQRTIKENITIDLALASSPLPVLADAGQVEQVIMNLFVNAADAMQDGGILTIKTELKKGGDGEDQTIVLSIKDTGSGMTEEVQSQIFEPFFSTKGELGTGLGLSTAYGIVKQHKGDISVASQPGEGTEFVITLPLGKGRPSPLTSQGKELSEPAGRENILIVEDSHQVLELTHSILENHGYRVYTAAGSSEALDFLRSREWQIDLLLTDIVMPGKNGKELYQEASVIRPEMKVLYMSGYNDNIISHTDGDQQSLHFIQKPFGVSDLLKKVREALDS